MELRGTTIIGVKRNGKTVIAGDGQATLGEHVIMKNNSKKVRRLYGDKVVIGFAGSVADAFALEARFEELLQKFSGNLLRSAVEVALGFRDDKYRKLDAQMIVADKDQMFIISGGGEVIEPESDVCSIGSGSLYAMASARALMENTELDALEIAKKSMKIASDMCVYTNNNLTIEEL
ncbi:MAG: ATP-dependent protease subunit HslV [Clostridia bacterium]|nr:ATP-dependent protease subunit HslV [Clostridia bacterium]